MTINPATAVPLSHDCGLGRDSVAKSVRYLARVMRGAAGRYTCWLSRLEEGACRHCASPPARPRFSLGLRELRRHRHRQEDVMTFFDKAKATAERAREQAAHGLEAGRVRLDEVQARRQHGRLLQKLGEAYYAEHCGEGDREGVVRGVGDLDRLG